MPFKSFRLKIKKCKHDEILLKYIIVVRMLASGKLKDLSLQVKKIKKYKS